MTRYRVAAAPSGWPEELPFRVSPIGHAVDYGIGEEFEHEFDSPADEAANLDSGLLEIVPCTYRVIGDTQIFEHQPGDEFVRALRMFEEQHLIEAGHIERVDAKSKRGKKKEDDQ